MRPSMRCLLFLACMVLACAGGSADTDAGLDLGADPGVEAGPDPASDTSPDTVADAAADPAGEADADAPEEAPEDLTAEPEGDAGSGPVTNALAAARALMAGPLAGATGWTAWAAGQTLQAGTALSTAMGEAFPQAPERESWLVYVDPEPGALIEHPVRWAFVPADGTDPVVLDATVPPDLEGMGLGVLMLQDTAPAGTPAANAGSAMVVAGDTGDYGDAPDTGEAYLDGTTGSFPTLEAHDGARTAGTGLLVLGAAVSLEKGASDPQDPDGVPNLTDRDADDGLAWAIWQGPDKAWWHRAVATVSVAAGGPARQYLNVLADLDRDGTWDEPDDREWRVKNLALDVAPGTTKTLEIDVPLQPDTPAANGAFWARVALTRDPIPDGWTGAGDLGDGEVEDHFIRANDFLEGKEPMPPGPKPGGGPGPVPGVNPDDEVCGVTVHRRALVVAGVDLKGHDHIVEATTTLLARAFQDVGFAIGPVATGTPADVTAALEAFFAGSSCLDEALVYFVAHGTAAGGGAMAFLGAEGHGTWWKASDVFAVLKGLGACAGGSLLKGDCTAKNRACRQTVVFESCHSGSFAGEIGQFGDDTEGRGIYFSTGAGTPAYTDGRIGLFSKAFADALAAGATPADAYQAAAAAAEAGAKDRYGQDQKAVSGLEKAANCPCDCCGDGKI